MGTGEFNVRGKPCNGLVSVHPNGGRGGGGIEIP